MQKSTRVRAVLYGLPIMLAACSDNTSTTAPNAPTAPAVSPAAGATQPMDKVLGDGKNNAHIVSGTGDITPAIADFRALFSGQLNGAKIGDQGDGHREVNWDGVGPGVTNTNNFPADFFNTTSPRGLVTSTPGTGFRVGDDGFITVNPGYAGEFVPFSPKKMFVAVGSTVTDVNFFVAGSTKAAVVTGFGSVFEDVGRAHSTTIEYFDAAGRSLLKVAAPRRSDANGISFVGAVFDAPIVARVRITAGDTPIGATAVDNVKGKGKKNDLVAMDDFIYGEPHEIH